MSITTIFGCVASLKPARLATNTQPFRQLLSYHQLPWNRRTTRFLPKINAGRRCYGSQGRVDTDGNPFAYTWVTKTPGDITPGDVLAGIDPIQVTSKERSNVLLLLVTPSFASWIDATSDFLEQCVNKLYTSSDSSPSNPLRLVAAVVDRLPDPYVSSEDERKSSFRDGKDTTESEGISLLHLGRADVLGKTTQPRRIRGSGAEIEPALAFSVQTTTSKEAGGGLVHGSVHEVGLRLANTTFINGNEHTLFGMLWVYNAASGKLEVSQSVNLTTCVVRSTAKAVRNSFGLPLRPVSQRRKVTSSMGNILSQVAKHVDGNSADSIPASFELEKELPRYAAEHDIVDQRVSVWALLEKPHCAVPLETDSQDRVTECLRAGCKLLHVMSGGGGWGKKQGLLSLDPETSFAEVTDHDNLSNFHDMFHGSGSGPGSEPNFPFPFPFDKRLPIDDLPFLSQLVDPGDYVQFFVSVESSSLRDRRSGMSKDGNGTTSFHFGVTSGAEGIMTEGINYKHKKDLVALPNYFGALSQKAITYSQSVGEREEEGASTTKLDVPGCRVDLELV